LIHYNITCLAKHLEAPDGTVDDRRRVTDGCGRETKPSSSATRRGVAKPYCGRQLRRFKKVEVPVLRPQALIAKSR